MEIAEKLDATKAKIQYWRSKNGLPHNGKLSDEEKKRRMKLYRKGLTDGDIAERVGVTVTAIWEWRKKHGLSANH